MRAAHLTHHPWEWKLIQPLWKTDIIKAERSHALKLSNFPLSLHTQKKCSYTPQDTHDKAYSGSLK